jgi:hypothetical protein
MASASCSRVAISFGRTDLLRKSRSVKSGSWQEPEPVGLVAEIHQQVAGLLADPGSGGPIGSMRDGYVHVATGQKNCEGKDTPAEPADQ